ncbi:hypothetical protein [Micromonospora sp. DT229]|uniref:sulfotransferase-like domain-containing protein n=1 Tax=Micromonospora sp. DT229 TaxID=3393430 RepID=UPI003CF4637E
MNRIIALWSAPRSRSTAFLRMMTARGDFTVLHEPFSHVADFGTAVVDGRTVHTEAELMAALRALAEREPVFFKDTTDFHYPGLLADDAFLRRHTHTFIIRRPAEVIASHYALNPALQRDEVGIERLSEIYDAVVAAGAGNPVVIDADDLVARPEATVRAYCAAVGIDFRPEALRWSAQMLPEWEKTRRWHEATAQTDSFSPQPRVFADTVQTNDLLARYHEHHLPFYERLRQHRLVVGS